MSFPVNRYSKTVHKHKKLFSCKQAIMPQIPVFCEIYSIINVFSHKKAHTSTDRTSMRIKNKSHPKGWLCVSKRKL